MPTNLSTEPQSGDAPNQVEEVVIEEQFEGLRYEAKKTDIPKLAYKLLIGVGGFIAFISFIIICFYLINLIRIGIPTTTLTETELVEFESLSKIFFDHTTQLFDLIITKGFLPIFATILGYLLGESRATNE